MNIKALAEQFMAAQDQAFRLGNFGPLEEVESPRVIVHIPPSPDFEGFEAHRQYAINVRESTTGFHREMDFVTGDGNVAVLSYKQKATLKVQPPFSQIPAGSTVIGEGFLVFRRESDRIAEIWVRGSNTVVSVEENKDAQRRLLQEVWNDGNLDLIPDLISPDYHHRDALGKEFNGQEGYRQMVTNWRVAFPDCHYTIDFIMGEGDWVSVRLSFRATFKGKLASFEPTGKEVSWTTANFIHWVNGKQVEMLQFVDMLNVFRQLGVAAPTQ